MIDNQKYRYGPKTGSNYISGTLTDSALNSNAKFGIFDDVGRARQKISQMIATTTDCQKLQDWRVKRLCVQFPVVGRRRNRPGSVRRAGRGRKPQVCRRNCSDICHTVGYICTTGLDGHVVISGYPSMSHLFVDTFFEFGVVDNFVYRARITVILTSDLFGCMSL